MKLIDRITGCIVGTAVGDAIGLPREGLSRRRSQKLFGGAPINHGLIARRGLCSDDTEHTVMVGQALIRSGFDSARFERDLARRLRWWLLRLPAGTGWATLRACLKLWLGFSPRRSGVFSAGNGPAMRTALLGIVAADERQMIALVRAATRLTHTDPRAEQGALMVAAAARAACDIATERAARATTVRTLIDRHVQDEGLAGRLHAAADAVASDLTAEQFAEQLGLHKGVSGFVNHTVPVAIFCWLAHPGSFREAVESIVLLGGDTDSTAAIVGALAGAEQGPAAIPNRWVNGLAEWPASVAWLRRLATALAEHATQHTAGKPPTVNLPGLLLRNLLFIAVVLVHGFRRLLPPY